METLCRIYLLTSVYELKLNLLIRGKLTKENKPSAVRAVPVGSYHDNHFLGMLQHTSDTQCIPTLLFFVADPRIFPFNIFLIVLIRNCIDTTFTMAEHKIHVFLRMRPTKKVVAPYELVDGTCFRDRARVCELCSTKK